jgi:hypothetical protein
MAPALSLAIRVPLQSLRRSAQNRAVKAAAMNETGRIDGRDSQFDRMTEINRLILKG